jgi:hypothetical protein
MCSFDGADLGTNSEVWVSFSVRCRNVCGTFVERFLLYCFDITKIGQFLLCASPLIANPPRFCMRNEQIANPEISEVCLSAYCKSANFYVTSWQHCKNRKASSLETIPKELCFKTIKKVVSFVGIYFSTNIILAIEACFCICKRYFRNCGSSRSAKQFDPQITKRIGSRNHKSAN